MKAQMEGDFRGTRRFQVLRRLGTGGMGVVYEAIDRETGASVALKTLRAPSAESLLRLKREFRALQDLRHPNLVSLGELVEDGGVWFFTMELIQGVNFVDYVRPDWRERRRHPRVVADADTAELAPGDPWPQAIAAADGNPGHDGARLRRGLAQLARGLCALHDAGMVHRDVKPSNILVTDAERVVLLDFGLVADAGPGRGWTEDNVVGTALYMAPEQAAGRPVGPEADWYGVGVLRTRRSPGRRRSSAPACRC